ncbi:MAG: S41 family peptidase [Gemmatimonadota bacterium]|jgi:carboxyl-terminal processing protease
MKTNRTVLAPIFVALVAMATGGWFLQRGVGQERNVYANAQLFEQVLSYVSQVFVDEEAPDSLYRMAIDGMLQELGDPHTAFLPAKDYENLRIQTQGEYGGLGISILKRAGWVTIVAPLPGTPGERAGLRAGDQIIEVNGESTKDWDDDLAVTRLRGPKGTVVDLKVARLGATKPIPFRITRDEIHIRSVPTAYMIDKDVGYVELVSFSESSTSEMRMAIDKLRGQGAKGIILDLRGNPGGLLEEGVSLSDLFLDAGMPVVDTKGRWSQSTQSLSASTPDEYAGMPLVVVVGPNSASAAEIVAGALQDHDRALVVGRPTYGKGSVQTVFRLSGNNHLKLTTARWYTPSGRSIQRPYSVGHPIADLSAAEDADTTETTYTTDSGRTVTGGGGIHPDLLIESDTTTLDERELIGALQQADWAKYLETLFAFGVRYNKEHPELQPGFPITPAALNEFYAALRDSGLDIDRSLYDGGKRWIAYQIGQEITMSRWGVAERRERQNRDDPSILAAVDLLKQADSPSSLFALAAQYEAAMKTAAAGPGSQN